MTEREEIIRASEVGQYVFCARAWWLGQVMGYRSTNVEAMAQGTAGHRAHGRIVERHLRLRRLATGLVLLALIALLAWMLLVLGR